MGRVRDVVLDWMADGPRVALAHLLAPETRAIQTTQSLQYGVEQWTDWNTQKAVLEGYESHFLVYRLTKFRGDAIRSLPLLAKDIRTGDPVAETHPAARMIASPNPRISMDELEFRVELFLCMAGDAYWYVNQVGDSVRLDPLRSDRVSIKAYKDKLVYLYTLPGETPVPFDETEIVHFKNFNPANDLFGQPVLRANAKIVDTGNAITNFQYHSMKNGLWPSGTLSTGKLEKGQYDHLKQQIDDFKKGSSNARQVLIIEDGTGFVPATPTPAEMDFMGGSNLTNQELCVGFGVSAEAIGLIPAKYENMRAAKRAAWEDTLLPEAELIKGTLNIQLAPHFDGIYFDYDLANSLPMIEARKDAAEEGRIYFNMGISTKAINERLKLGFDEADCPDEGMFPVTLLPVGTSRVQEGARDIRAIRDGALDLHYRATDRRRQGWERGVTEKVKDLFAAESSVVVKAVEGGAIDTDPAIDSQRSKWLKMLTSVYREIFVDFGQAVMDELVPRSRIERRDFDPWSKEIEKYVNAHVAEEITLIQDTTKKRIRTIILEGEKAGLSTVKIARSIRETFAEWEGGTGVYRSMMIARTEVHQAAGTAMHESARQSGVAKEKAWLDAGDDRVRPQHVNNTAQGWIPFDDAYQDGAMYPGDGTDDVNCRCVEQYRDR